MTLIKDLRRSLTAEVALLPLCFFIVIPAHLAKVNIAELGHFDPRAFLIFFAIAVAVFLIFWLANFVFLKSSGHDYFSKLLEFALFVVLITGFFLPASVGVGMVDPRSLAVNKLNVFAALALAGVMMVISSRHRKWVYLVVTAFVVINLAFAIPAIYSLAGQQNRPNRSILELSATKNIIVLSFDGIPGPVVTELLRDDSHLRSTLSGFVVYERVASSSPATNASTFTSLFGNGNFQESARTGRELWEIEPEKLITHRLRNGGYNVSAFGKYNDGISDANPEGINPPLVQRISSSPTLLYYSIARTITRYFVPRGQLRGKIQLLFDSLLISRGAEDDELVRQIAASYAPTWKKEGFTPNVLDFREYVKNLHLSRNEPVAQFLHFTHTHYPVEFDRHCQFHAHDFDWFTSHQNRQSVKEEAYCVLQQISQFIAKLKELDVFDKTLIVLKSDHGKPVKYNDPSRIESFKIRGNSLWGYGRYLPFLAIKDFGAKNAEASFDRHPVILDDLPKTLCIHSDISIECSQYSGYDLLSAAFEGIEKDQVTIYVVKNVDATYQYETHDAIVIERGADIVESLFASLSREYLRSGVRCKSPINVLAANNLHNGHSDSESWMTWSHGGGLYLRFRNDNRCTSARLRVGGDKSFHVGSASRIFVNGVMVGTSNPDRASGDLEILVNLPDSPESPGDTADVLIEIRPIDQNAGSFAQVLGIEFGASATSR